MAVLSNSLGLSNSFIQCIMTLKVLTASCFIFNLLPYPLSLSALVPPPLLPLLPLLLCAGCDVSSYRGSSGEDEE